MISTSFTYSVTEGHKITVNAIAKSVTSYSAKGLSIQILDEHGDEYDQVLDEETASLVEEQAIEELYNVKYEQGDGDLESAMNDHFSEGE